MNEKIDKLKDEIAIRYIRIGMILMLQQVKAHFELSNETIFLGNIEEEIRQGLWDHLYKRGEHEGHQKSVIDSSVTNG